MKDIKSANKMDRPITALTDRLIKEGISNAETREGARQTIYYWMRNSRLELRRKENSKRYIVNNDEIEEIVKAFSRGGKGYFYADKEGGD